VRDLRFCDTVLFGRILPTFRRDILPEKYVALKLL